MDDAERRALRRARYRGNASDEEGQHKPPAASDEEGQRKPPAASFREVVQNVHQQVYHEPSTSQRLRLYARRDLFASHARRVKAMNKKRDERAALHTRLEELARAADPKGLDGKLPPNARGPLPPRQTLPIFVPAGGAGAAAGGGGAGGGGFGGAPAPAASSSLLSPRSRDTEKWLNKMWLAKRTKEMVEQRNRGEVKWALEQWAISRGRIEEEIARRQESRRYASQTGVFARRRPGGEQDPYRRRLFPRAQSAPRSRAAPASAVRADPHGGGPGARVAVAGRGARGDRAPGVGAGAAAHDDAGHPHAFLGRVGKSSLHIGALAGTRGMERAQRACGLLGEFYLEPRSTEQ